MSPRALYTVYPNCHVVAFLNCMFCNARLTCEASTGQLCECMYAWAVRVKVRVHACVCVWGGASLQCFIALRMCCLHVAEPGDTQKVKQRL